MPSLARPSACLAREESGNSGYQELHAWPNAIMAVFKPPSDATIPDELYRGAVTAVPANHCMAGVCSVELHIQGFNDYVVCPAFMQDLLNF
jgi:hypothetical protein